MPEEARCRPAWACLESTMSCLGQGEVFVGLLQWQKQAHKKEGLEVRKRRGWV